jgi:hypothetical protein
MILLLARQALAYLAISPVNLWFHGGILARKSQWG